MKESEIIDKIRSVSEEQKKRLEAVMRGVLSGKSPEEKKPEDHKQEEFSND